MQPLRIAGVLAAGGDVVVRPQVKPVG